MGSAPRPATCRSTSAPHDLTPKAELKRNFLLRQNMKPTHGRVPLFGIVSRLASQKGFDLLTDTLPKLLQNARRAHRGGGHRRRVVREVLSRVSAAQHPRPRVVLRAATTRAWRTGSRARATCSSCPRSTSPAGSTRCTACATARFPIVRKTGGLADSVHALRSRHGRRHGHRVQRFRCDRDELGAGHRDAVVRAAGALGAHGAERHALDFSWETQCNEYLKLFAGLLQLDAATLIKRNAPQKAAG